MKNIRTIKIVKIVSSDGKKDIPEGTLIYGQGSLQNLPTLDSIVSKDLSEELKKTILTAMQSVFTQLSYPEAKVKIGKSFKL